MLEARRLDQAGQQANDAADGMPDVDDRPRGQVVQQVQQVEGIALQRAVPLVAVRQAVRAAETHMVEQQDLVPCCEGVGHGAPRGLVRAEAVAEHQRGVALTEKMPMVARAMHHA